MTVGSKVSCCCTVDANCAIGQSNCDSMVLYRNIVLGTSDPIVFNDVHSKTGEPCTHTLSGPVHSACGIKVWNEGEHCFYAGYYDPSCASCSFLQIGCVQFTELQIHNMGMQLPPGVSFGDYRYIASFTANHPCVQNNCLYVPGSYNVRIWYDLGPATGDVFPNGEFEPYSVTRSTFLPHPPETVILSNWEDAPNAVISDGCPQCDPPPPDIRACCFKNGTCIDVTAQECTAAGGQQQGLGSTCDNTDCTPPPPTGACCFSDTSCNVLQQGQCEQFNGEYQGDGTVCHDKLCGDPVIVPCCFEDGSCGEFTEMECISLGGNVPQDSLSCNENPCRTPPGNVACCVGSSCFDIVGCGACVQLGGICQCDGIDETCECNGGVPIICTIDP